MNACGHNFGLTRVDGEHHKAPNSSARYLEGTKLMSPKTH